MQLHLLLERLVTEGELFDITPVSEAVFEKGIRCILSKSLYEQLEISSTFYRVGNTPYEEMLLDIKNSFTNNAWFKENIGSDISDIRGFLAHGRSACFALEILKMPGFLVVCFPLREVTTLLICEQDEAPEHFGIYI